MASIRTKFAVGLFVLGGTVLAAAAVIVLGMSRYLEKGRFFAVYFNESIQGLNEDSVVKYRGVPIGRVNGIGVAPDGKLVEVILKIEPDVTPQDSMVAQLKSVGITGIMFIELDLKEDGKPDLSPPLTFQAPYPVLASKPSEISRFFQGIEQVFTQLQSMDLAGAVRQLRSTLATLEQVVHGADVPELSNKLSGSLDRVGALLESGKLESIVESLRQTAPQLAGAVADARKVLSRLEGSVGQVEQMLASNRSTLDRALEDLIKAAREAAGMLERGGDLVDGTGSGLASLQGHLLAAAGNLAQATEKLDRLLEQVSAQPSRLLWSQPPRPRKVEER